jgi:hypothetical protein
MPARKRHKKEPEHPDPLVRFGRALKEREAKERAEAARRKAEAEEVRRQAILAAEHAAAVQHANRRLEHAIEAVKAARAKRQGIDDADAAYRAAKARVVELETGMLPSWAPGTRDVPTPGDEDSGAEVQDADSESA